MIDNLQKERPAGFGHARQVAKNVIVDKFAQFVWSDPGGNIRIKHFQEIAEFFALGFFAKFFEGEQGLAVLLQLIDESD